MCLLWFSPLLVCSRDAALGARHPIGNMVLVVLEGCERREVRLLLAVALQVVGCASTALRSTRSRNAFNVLRVSSYTSPERRLTPPRRASRRMAALEMALRVLRFCARRRTGTAVGLVAQRAARVRRRGETREALLGADLPMKPQKGFVGVPIGGRKDLGYTAH